MQNFLRLFGFAVTAGGIIFFIHAATLDIPAETTAEMLRAERAKSTANFLLWQGTSLVLIIEVARKQKIIDRLQKALNEEPEPSSDA